MITYFPATLTTRFGLLRRVRSEQKSANDTCEFWKASDSRGKWRGGEKEEDEGRKVKGKMSRKSEERRGEEREGRRRRGEKMWGRVKRRKEEREWIMGEERKTEESRAGNRKEGYMGDHK